MSDFRCKRFLSVLMGALTVLGSSVASAGKRRMKKDVLGSEKSSSRRRTNRNIRRKHGRNIKADLKVNGVNGLEGVLKETDGKVVGVSSDNKGGFVAFIKTSTGKVVAVSVVGVPLLILCSYLAYSALSGNKKNDGSGQKPGDLNKQQNNQEEPKDLNDPKQNNQEEPKVEGPGNGAGVVNYKVMSDLLSGKDMEKLFFECLFGKVFAPCWGASLTGLVGKKEKANELSVAVDEFFVDLVANRFSEGKNGEVVISLQKFGTWYSVKSYVYDAFYLGAVSDTAGDTRDVSWWLSKFIANKDNKSGELLLLDRTQKNFLKLIFLTCWYYAFVSSNGRKEFFSVKSLNERFDSEDGKKVIFEAWDAISKYVDYLFEEAEKKKKV